MEINGGAMHCSRCRSPSSDRFPRLFTHPGLLPAAGVSEELNDADLFWTVDSPPSDGLLPPPVESKYQLAEMPSSGTRLLQESAATPMTVSMSMRVPNKAIAVEFIGGQTREFDVGGDEDYDRLMAPHEIVDARVKSTASVLHGVGRTLKGGDLRRVRNAVLRQTGFLD